MTWDLEDQVVLSLPSGEEIVWSIQEDKPVFETLHGTLYVRCKFRRLHGADSVSTQTLSMWQTEFFEEEPLPEIELEQVDIAKYARLLADGLISLEDFNLLTNQAPFSSNQLDEDTNQIDPLYEEFVLAIDACWPDVVKRNTDIFGRVTISGVPKEVDRYFIEIKLKQEKNTFDRTISTASGLVWLALEFGAGIQLAGLPKTYIGGYMQGAAGFPVLTKFFEKELRRGKRSDETNTIIQRYRDDIRRRQSRIRLFTSKIGWTGIDFF
jgi:hypothetical protein